MAEMTVQLSEVINGRAVTKPLILGRYIVADPRICHGKPTFRGTRIFVADVLEQLAEGIDWESISESWGQLLKFYRWRG